MIICKSNRKCVVCDLLITVNLFVMFQTCDTRPHLEHDGIVNVDRARLTNTYNSNKIVFPGSDEDLSEESFVPPIFPLTKAPLCTRDGQTFCENVDSYPHAQIQSFLEKSNTPNSMFGVDEAPDEFIVRSDVEQFMCNAKQQIIFPRVGRTKDKTWKYILNQGNSTSGGYIQGVLIRSCNSQNEPCQFADNLPLGYVATCKQMYIYRKLLSLNAEGITVHEYFELPSACCCSYKQKYSYWFRRNTNVSPVNEKQNIVFS